MSTGYGISCAAAMIVSGRAAGWEEGIAIGGHSLDQGKAYQAMKDLVKISNE